MGESEDSSRDDLDELAFPTWAVVIAWIVIIALVGIFIWLVVALDNMHLFPAEPER